MLATIDVGLWRVPAYSGKYVKFSDLLFYPEPVQKPHLPLWIGSESVPALTPTAHCESGRILE
jgi:alkanesulfonate monooxygenase SsuD/methylene tetrahydromethanopterin reductase-like flavin-dependent oxidoreductase (luciferase family)